MEIIVIDDQSEDTTAEVARREGCIVMTSRDCQKVGLKTLGMLAGSPDATGDIFLFLDADTFLEPEGLSKIVSTISKRGLLSIQPFHKMKKKI